MRVPERPRRRSTFAVSIALVGAMSLNLPGQRVQCGIQAGFLGSPEPERIRVMTWNIGADSVFPPAGARLDVPGEGRPGQFARVLRALRPDVMCLQEVTHKPKDVAAFVTAILPSGVGQTWRAHTFFDSAIVSRFPLTSKAGRVFTQGALRRGHATALVDLPNDSYSRDLYVICAHFQSRAGQAQIELRQRQADAVVAWIRDAKAVGGKITLPQNTPFTVLGDLNVIDTPSPSLETLLTGDISDERTFGPDIRPDWDGSDLIDLLPHHNERGADTYTWRDDTEPFPPGVLDRILYADSVITIGRSFVLNTTSMTDDELRRAGLRATDVMREPAKGVYDHLPVVTDFVFPHGTTPRGARAPGD